MCEFFSFISNGHGRFMYFDFNERLERKSISISLDSHTSIAHRYGISDDNVNKYELTHTGFIVDQINLRRDDSRQALKWANQFVKTDEFREICEISGYKYDEFYKSYLNTQEILNFKNKITGTNKQFNKLWTSLKKRVNKKGSKKK